MIQWQVDDGGGASVGAATQPDVGTQAEGEPVSEGDSRKKKADLARLAQEIYPIIKRMLTVERERGG